MPEYTATSMSLVIFTLSCFTYCSSLWKSAVGLVLAGLYMAISYFCYRIDFERADKFQKDCCHDGKYFSQLWIICGLLVVSALLIVLVHSHLVEITVRLDFIWKFQAYEENENTEELKRRNRKLVNNILPAHVAEHFLNFQETKDPQDLYWEHCLETTVIFASISNFSEFYLELAKTNEDVCCLVLNEIISDFDDLQKQFKCVEKIKTIGSTYMAAAGLSACTRLPERGQVEQVADFAQALLKVMAVVNRNLYNSFKMRIGINHGVVIAGVIAARKPQYDIWGDTVNIASRMESSGLEDSIQVTDAVRDILQPKGYNFQLRQPPITVKGVGSPMSTHFLLSGPRDPLVYVRESMPESHAV